MSTLEQPEGPESDEPGEVAEPDEPDPKAAPEPEEPGSTLEHESDPREASEIAVDRSKIRKAPRYGRFATIGVLLGLLAALAQSLAASPEAIAQAGGPWASNAWGFFWLMSAVFVPIGVLAMCALALLLDRRSGRTRSRKVKK